MANNTVFTVPSIATILQSAVQNYQQMANYFGYQTVLTPTDELYMRLNTIASLVGILYQYDNQLTNSKIVDSATGNDLDRIANLYGFTRRTATSSQGAVSLVSSQPQTLLAGSALTGPNGLTFQVLTSGTFNNGQNVNIVSVDTGYLTNLPVGSIMTWQQPTSTMQATALVSVACTGGNDTENDESFRNRIYLSIQAPPQMGNATQVISVATSVDNLIQQAYTYSNFNGAGTQMIALTGYQTGSYIGRDIPHLQYDNFINVYGTTVLNPSLITQIGGFGAYNQYTLASHNQGPNLSNDSSIIYGQLPATVSNPFATVITTVNNQPSDVAVSLTIPYPVGASPNGLGNGWLQAVPWPVPDGYYVQNYCAVKSITSSTVITISAPSSGTYNTTNPYAGANTYTNQSPVQGQTQIQWVNRSDANQNGWVVVTATILTAVDNGNQTWTLTLDTPLVFATGTQDFYGNTGVEVGDFIFPACQNAQTYVNNMLASYSLMGPGEVISNQGLLALGAARYPSNNTTFPNVLGPLAEKLLEINNEVFQAQIEPGVGLPVVGAIGPVYNAWNTANAAPPLNSPPNIWIPRNMAFYPAELYNQFGV